MKEGQEKPSAPLLPRGDQPWRILIVDDDEDIIASTRLALKGFQVENRSLELTSASSAEKGLEILRQDPHFALAILDVVMESESSGLDMARAIREELNNHLVRLVIRTGQPGTTTELEIVERYDINDYREKTELNSVKIKTLVYTALRSYRDLCRVEESRRGIRNVLDAASGVTAMASLQEFPERVREHLGMILRRPPSAVAIVSSPGQGDHQERNFLARVTGVQSLNAYEQLEDLPQDFRAPIQACLAQKADLHQEKVHVSFLESERGSSNLICALFNEALNDVERDLVNLFCANVNLTFETLMHSEDMQEAQRKLVYLLGDAVESRSKETGAHVRRVSLVCEGLARAVGLDEATVERIKFAAPLHDVGKIAIPDEILHKPGRLSGQEWEVMKSHAAIGESILRQHPQALFQEAAIIAGGHHERWDGLGYPRGLAGESIPLSARIVALADVFDALGSRRSYKAPWAIPELKAYLLEQRGRIFDPKLLDLLLEDFDQYLAIRVAYPDLQEHAS